MSFEHNIKIPLDRVGVLIGKNGEVKRMIEKRCGVMIDVDGESGEVTIKSNAPLEYIDPFKAKEMITAIARGFSPDKARRLLEEDVILQDIDLNEYGRSRNTLERIKGRLIGANGKSRRVIEELSGAYVSIYGHYVSLIGKYEEVRVALEAVTMLVQGSTHKSVYNMLQNTKRRHKTERLRLWEEKV